MFKRVFVAVLVFAVIATNAYAAVVPEISPQNQYINSVSATLKIADGFADCHGECICGCYKVSVSVTLQRSSDGSSWTNLKTWNGSGEDGCEAGGLWLIFRGYQYRLKITGRAYSPESGALLEQIVRYSTPKSYY